MTNTDVLSNQKEAVDFNQFMKLVKKSHAQAMITVNYGTGRRIGAKSGQSGAQIAADWVYYANVLHHYDIKYWEIGNEVYGNGTYGANWEPDDHCQTSAGTPVTVGQEPSQTYGCGPSVYAQNVQRYIAAMKAVDPHISVGVVMTASGAPNSWPAGQSPSWNKTVLSTVGSQIGFADVHWYAQNPGSESDHGLLAFTSEIPRAVKTLRQELANDAHNPHVPIMITETNSVSYNPGKQTLSVVNALFLDQNYLAWLENGVANVDWWQIENGIVTNGNNSASLVGSANYGDYGLLSNGSCATAGGKTICEPPAETPFSSYDGLAMLSRFIHPGDQFLAVSSDQSTVNAYAVRTKEGNVRIMLVNDRASNQYAVNVDMPGYRVKPGGRVYSFGPGQSGIHVAHAHAGLTLPGYTVTVFTLSPLRGH